MFCGWGVWASARVFAPAIYNAFTHVQKLPSNFSNLSSKRLRNIFANTMHMCVFMRLHFVYVAAYVRGLKDWLIHTFNKSSDDAGAPPPRRAVSLFDKYSIYLRCG